MSVSTVTVSHIYSLHSNNKVTMQIEICLFMCLTRKRVSWGLKENTVNFLSVSKRHTLKHWVCVSHWGVKTTRRGSFFTPALLISFPVVLGKFSPHLSAGRRRRNVFQLHRNWKDWSREVIADQCCTKHCTILALMKKICLIINVINKYILFNTCKSISMNKYIVWFIG